MKNLLKKGDLVTSDFYRDEESTVRKITDIKKDKTYGSGYCASADGGDICECCKKPSGKVIIRVDAAWFKKVK